MVDLNIAVTTTENTNMGDHGERLTRAHEYVPGETVEELVRRVLFSGYGRTDPTDVVTLRVLVAHDGSFPDKNPDAWA